MQPAAILCPPTLSESGLHKENFWTEQEMWKDPPHSTDLGLLQPRGEALSPRDSQESSPTPQFKSINSLVLSFLYSPTLTSILDYWRDHSFN